MPSLFYYEMNFPYSLKKLIEVMAKWNGSSPNLKKTKKKDCLD